VPLRYHQVMGLIRKAIFLGTAATGTPLVRWNSSAEAAAKEQRELMREQNDILSEIAERADHDIDDDDIDDDFEDYAPPARRAVQQAEPTLTDKLTEIKALLDKGVITTDEHAAMRKKILGV